jgi:hypothetical protein
MEIRWWKGVAKPRYFHLSLQRENGFHINNSIVVELLPRAIVDDGLAQRPVLNGDRSGIVTDQGS